MMRSSSSASYVSIIRESNGRVQSPTNNFEYQFKLVLIGEAGVGKTSLFNRIKSDQFSNHVTVGIDHCHKIVYMDSGESVKLNIWDTAGQERFKTLTRNYYRDCDAVLFVFAINDASSFNCLSKWNDDVEKILGMEVSKILVGSKNDCSSVLNIQSIQDFCDVRSCQHFCSTSALTGVGVDSMLKSVARVLIDKLQNVHSKSNRYSELSASNQQSSKYCPC